MNSFDFIQFDFECEFIWFEFYLILNLIEFYLILNLIEFYLISEFDWIWLNLIELDLESVCVDYPPNAHSETESVKCNSINSNWIKARVHHCLFTEETLSSEHVAARRGMLIESHTLSPVIMLQHVHYHHTISSHTPSQQAWHRQKESKQIRQTDSYSQLFKKKKK